MLDLAVLLVVRPNVEGIVGKLYIGKKIRQKQRCLLLASAKHGATQNDKTTQRSVSLCNRESVITRGQHPLVVRYNSASLSSLALCYIVVFPGRESALARGVLSLCWVVPVGRVKCYVLTRCACCCWKRMPPLPHVLDCSFLWPYGPV